VSFVKILAGGSIVTKKTVKLITAVAVRNMSFFNDFLFIQDP
jgi:hypothetical protein